MENEFVWVLLNDLFKAINYFDIKLYLNNNCY